MMHRIKYAIFDMDGTVVPGNEEISQEMVDTLHRLMDCGITLGFATGRNFHFASEIADKIQGKFYLAVYNGAIIYRYPEKEIISEVFLPKVDVEKVRCDLSEKSHPCIVGTVQGQERLYTFTQPKTRPPIQDFLKSQILNSKIIENLHQSDLTKFTCLYAAVPSVDIEREIHSFRAQYPRFNFTYIGDPHYKDYHWFCLMPQNTGKENLLKYFQNQYGARLEEMLAAGDDMNDLGMLQLAGMSIAMGTAPALVRETAKITIGSAKENSLGKFLQDNLLSL